MPGVDSEQDRRALSYVLEEAKLENSNRRKVIEEAANDLADNPAEEDAPSSMSDDWLNTFAKIASDKSDADIQRLWGRILSGEIRRPGSVKLRTLSSLATFDKEDAAFAHYLLAHTVNGQWVLNDYFIETETFRHLLRGRELELIMSESSMTYKSENFPAYVRIANGARMLMRATADAPVKIDSVSSLTSLGRTLHGFLDEPAVDQKYIEMVADNFRRSGLQVDFDAWGKQRVVVTI